MAPLTQAKILRLLQEQTFERLGGNETVRADVRLIAATNVDLEAAVEQGRFRNDLYFRLNVFSIRLPPLRERGDDLDRLAEHYAGRFGVELGKRIDAIAPDTWEALRRHHWPGNVRELQSVLKQSILQMRGRVLLPEDLPAHLLDGEAPARPPDGFDWDGFVAGRIVAGSESLYAESLELMERELLVRVLRHTEGNQVQAARVLGITRGSLRNKIKALGISIGRSISADDEGEGRPGYE